jgi:hypothetical protein
MIELDRGSFRLLDVAVFVPRNDFHRRVRVVPHSPAERRHDLHAIERQPVTGSHQCYEIGLEAHEVREELTPGLATLGHERRHSLDAADLKSAEMVKRVDHHRHEPAEWVASVLFLRRFAELAGSSRRVTEQWKVSARCEVEVFDAIRRRPAIGAWPLTPVLVGELVGEGT